MTEACCSLRPRVIGTWQFSTGTGGAAQLAVTEVFRRVEKRHASRSCMRIASSSCELRPDLQRDLFRHLPALSAKERMEGGRERGAEGEMDEGGRERVRERERGTEIGTEINTDSEISEDEHTGVKTVRAKKQ